MARKINIKTTDKTNYEQNTQMSSSADPRRLDGEKLEEVSNVESIGRYDDFAELKIPPSRYSAADDKGYGIKFKQSVHGNKGADRIRDHQKEAAKLFLSDLRGFGLLADCVGSGKTYEACVVISELAVRGRIENLLIIVPDHALLNKWKYVVEMEFGFGKGNLQEVDALDHIEHRTKVPGKECWKPTGAYIMTYESFTHAAKDAIRNTLFDLIVVDEAHNLCKIADDNMNSMYYLSLMMQTKKENDKPFCLLLTATPHSGNLAQMFNLWYFIRCKGGIPECFRKEGKPSGRELEEYEKERHYYTTVVCKGASTVAEYIEKAECEFLVGIRGVKSEIRDRFFAAFSTIDYSGTSRKRVEFDAITYDDYLALKDYQKKKRARTFLSMTENADIRRRAIDAVNQSYVNVVMRSIMVRRRNSFAVSRHAFSYFFLPIDKPMEITLAPDRKNATPIFMIDGTSCSVDESERLFTDQDGYRNILFEQNPHFIKAGGAGREGFSNFYSAAFSRIAATSNDFVRILQLPCEVADEEQKVFAAKCDKFIELVRALRANKDKSNHRVIVFFDYKTEDNSALDDKDSTWKKLLAYLKEHKANDLLDSIIEGTTDNIKDSIKLYDEKEDAILLAEDQTFTEGQDLQNGNIVINFEVPIDPLTVDQRIGRVYRMGQAEGVEVHSFATMSRLDGYCLAYFAAIGILSDTDGDATILSGCNSDSMKVLRCPACKDVSLIYESDYGELLPDCEICKEKGVSDAKMEPRVLTSADGIRSEVFVCKHDSTHRRDIPTDYPLRCTCQSDRSPIRETIVVNEFVCENDARHRIKRAKDKGYDYVCMSSKRNKMSRTQDAEGNNIVGCSKLCAFKNCRYVKDGCQLRKKIDTISNVEEAKVICACCQYWDDCKCRIDNGDGPKDMSVMNSCNFCSKSNGFACGMQPYSINFGIDYKTGVCPTCGGNLLQIQANTFETFILGRYENDKTFCDNFKREMENTLDIKKIIIFDH